MERITGSRQKRRRVYIYAERTEDAWDLKERLRAGVMADALPARGTSAEATFSIYDDPFENTERFGAGLKVSPFQNAGVMQGCTVMTAKVEAVYEGPSKTLGDVLVSDSEVPEEFFVDEASLPNGAISRVGRASRVSIKRQALRIDILKVPWHFPTPWTHLPEPSLPVRGGSASRSKHIVEVSGGRYRRLVPDELDQLQGFPKGWTDTGMTDINRAFCMGNALIVGIPMPDWQSDCPQVVSNFEIRS